MYSLPKSLYAFKLLMQDYFDLFNYLCESKFPNPNLSELDYIELY